MIKINMLFLNKTRREKMAKPGKHGGLMTVIDNIILHTHIYSEREKHQVQKQSSSLIN